MFATLARTVPISLQARNVACAMNSMRFFSAGKDKIIYVKDSKQYDDLIASPKPSIMYFFATWCGPCKRMAPIYADLSNKYDSINFAKIDIDEVGDVASLENIESVPTFKLYVDKMLSGQFAGASPDNLNTMVEYALKSKK